MMLRVRRYIEEDSTALWAIFFNTVRHVNIQDYSQDQVNAWAPEAFDAEVWKTK
jgi:putative acetyltransferase